MKRFAKLLSLAILLAIVWAGCERKDLSTQVAPVYIKMLESALLRYRSDYERWPILDGQKAEQDNAEIVAILTADPHNDLVPKYNPAKVKFLQLGAAKIRDGAILDPWNNPYHIALDVEGKQEITIGQKKIPARVAIWSNGPNGIDEQGDGDDIVSWSIPK